MISRLYEIESGNILIDGQDINQVSLDSLHRNISVIPQTPFLFSGTIKKNLDPFESNSE